MAKLKSHLFVCTNAPDREGRCGNKNSEQLRKYIKAQCANEPWEKDVRINSSGCLGHCEEGIVAVLYPEQEWFFELKDSDGEILFQKLKASVEKRN